MQNARSSDELSIALVAGEASGDLLGAALIGALREHYPQARFFGVGGERMQAAGFECWWSRDELSVMGLFEVVRHLPRLLRLRRNIRQRLLEARPDLMIGIDAPDFNLGLERGLREAGVLTVHYVSPTVWAWRSGRAAKIRESAELVLCLFPFEPEFYRDHGVSARYTGHPLADAIPLHNDAGPARQALELADDKTWVALLPGSRAGEIERLAAPMLEAAGLLAQADPTIGFIAPMADPRAAQLFQHQLDAQTGVACRIVQGRALECMAAADVVVCASGTASLECMLVNRPMVVVYKLAPATYRTAKTLNLVKTQFVALPNILAREGLVPELLQHQVTGRAIAREVRNWLDQPTRRTALRHRFESIHLQLRCDAANSAARAIQELLTSHGLPTAG